MTAMIFIDPALHVASVPATYVAPGTLQNFGVSATAGSSSGTLPATLPNGAAYGSYTYTVVVGNTVENATADIISGYFTGTGALAVIPVGFAPIKVTVINWTDGIKWEWFFGAPSTDTLKWTSAADMAVDTTTAISVVADADGGIGNACYVVLTAALAANSKVLSYRIEA